MTFPLCSTWATAEDVTACGEVTCEDEMLTTMLEASTYILYLLSRRKYPGICTATVTPCASQPHSLIIDGWQPSWGVLRPWGWCCNPRHSEGFQCDCGHGPSQVTLGKFPVLPDTVSVEIDGVTLDADEYRVLGNRWLVRMADADGNAQCWPSRQRLDLPLGEVGTWSVTFDYGALPPTPGVLACAEYARELCLACTPGSEGECILPARVQSLTRQGVQIAFADPLAFLNNGLVGTPLADAWLSAERFGDKNGQVMFINPDDHVRTVPVPEPFAS